MTLNIFVLIVAVSQLHRIRQHAVYVHLETEPSVSSTFYLKIAKVRSFSFQTLG